MSIFGQCQDGKEQDQRRPMEKVSRDPKIKEIFIEVDEGALSDPASLNKIRRYMGTNVLLTLYVITTMNLSYWWASCLIRERLKAVGANDIAQAVIICPTSS